MNIWIFNHYAVPPNSSGSTRHFDLSKQLVKQGNTVTIFASSFEHQKREEKVKYEKKEKCVVKVYEGVTFIWLKTYPYKKNDWRRILNMITYTFHAYREANRIEDKPDIIIGSLMHPLAAILGYIIAKRKKARFYFEERDLWPQSLIDLGKVSKNNPIVWILSKLELFLYKKADRIIVLFDKAVEYVVRRGISKEKVIYLPNGVDLEMFDNITDLPDKLKNQVSNLNQKFVAIYTGSHGLANNLDALLDTADILKKNKDILFLLIGDGPEKPRLMERKEKEDLDNVIFLSAVSKKYIPSILKHGNVGLITMWNANVYKWGFSLNKSYDYMAASLPIVLMSSIQNSLIEKSGGVIRVDKPEQMAEQLEYLYKNQFICREMGKKSYSYVLNNNSWSSLANSLSKFIYEDIRETSSKKH